MTTPRKLPVQDEPPLETHWGDDPEKLLEWVMHAWPGESRQYYLGFLARDRSQFLHLPGLDGARLAGYLADQGLVLLVQKQLSHMSVNGNRGPIFSYIAVRSSRPYP